MRNCPVPGDFEVCELVTTAGQEYLKLRTRSEVIVTENKRQSKKTKAMRKSNAGVKLAFIARLKQLEKSGVPYSSVNEYLRTELDVNNAHLNPFGMGYLVEMITYDPRNGFNHQTKSYADVYLAVEQVPSSVNWRSMAEIVDGMDLA